MWKFLKRQFKTKTGKLAIGVIGGSILDGILKSTVGISAVDIPMAGPIIESILGPELSTGFLGLAYLRDAKAKEEHPDV